MRQALGGMLWSKQFYHYDVDRWLRGDPGHPAPPAERLTCASVMQWKARSQAGGPQHGLAPRRQPRRDLDAGQVGVPLVRDDAELHVLPTLWFRNRWSWGD